ncbi:hypothetical protein D3C72_1879760 [compost metagenome]
MLRPAASSEARLTRRPLDSFSSDLPNARSVLVMLRWVFIAEMLVLIRKDTGQVLLGKRGRCPYLHERLIRVSPPVVAVASGGHPPDHSGAIRSSFSPARQIFFCHPPSTCVKRSSPALIRAGELR